jgi:hypothetical protein
MNRRQFIALLGGAAATWPFSAHGEQPDRMRRIGVLTPLFADDPGSAIRTGREFRRRPMLTTSLMERRAASSRPRGSRP